MSSSFSTVAIFRPKAAVLEPLERFLGKSACVVVGEVVDDLS